MDFNQAVTAHQRWKSRLLLLIEEGSDEGLDPNLISRDDACDLGLWIRDRGPAECGRHPEFAAMKDAHTRFHRAAGSVARKALSGDRQGARELLEGDYFALSSGVVLAITRLQKACGK